MKTKRLSIGELILVVIAKTRMTKKDLAELLRVDRGTLNAYLEETSEPPASVLQRLLELSGLNIAVLMGNVAVEPSHPRLPEIKAAKGFREKDAVLRKMFNDGEVLQPGALEIAAHLIEAATTAEDKAMAFNRRSGFQEQ